MNGRIQYAHAQALTSETTPMPGSDLSSRLGRFRQDFREIGRSATRGELAWLLSRARELDLTDEAIHDERAEILAALDAIDFADRIAREGLPQIASGERLKSQRSHFMIPVRFGRRRSDQCGHLELTSQSLRFHGALDLSVVWSEVIRVERLGREIDVSLADSTRTLRFCCETLTDAARGTVVAQTLAGGPVAC